MRCNHQGGCQWAKSVLVMQRSILQSSQSSYDSLYEEANNLLKNLHFQRLLRHGPDSPEPAEKGTLSIF